MERETKKYLLTRISEVGYPERRWPREPTSVRRARRILSRFDAAQFREDEKLRKRFKKLREKAEHSVHFGTERQALAALAKLEACK